MVVCYSVLHRKAPVVASPGLFVVLYGSTYFIFVYWHYKHMPKQFSIYGILLLSDLAD